MIKYLYFISPFVIASSCLADMVVPTRTIRADAIIRENDVALHRGQNADVFDRLSYVIGKEARVALYAGRPIRFDEIGPPAIINRNQIVGAFFTGNGLRIATEVRALERGGVGDYIRVMNLASRATIFGQVLPDGSVQIAN
ncbi:flagella basal body P-ring formation protein FlgA [Sulfitobacter marinus]|uniref:Flagella basal body P-ring formation protein FlgA n=1 Tax=Sulfitobacter marinus TaxID=394264 RepID=A0A1I6TEB5_9RHOB|nr:flagellar basal body P-ring formation chaperone FlgA [Sulfitobacter marinus]SFS87493.1 flagella basal body P-ring formation protein FlgA [Sulfitobacter marinus]